MCVFPMFLCSSTAPDKQMPANLWSSDLRHNHSLFLKHEQKEKDEEESSKKTADTR